MLIHISGPSRSGKDTAADMAIDYLNHRGIEAVKIKLSSGIKSTLELLYNLPDGALELEEYRNKVVPGMDITFLEALVLSWSDSQKTIFGNFWITSVAFKIQDALDSGKWVILTDLRQEYEATLISTNQDWLNKYFGFQIKGRGIFKDSDVLVESLFAQLSSQSPLKPPIETIYNTRSMFYLRLCVKKNLYALIRELA